MEIIYMTQAGVIYKLVYTTISKNIYSRKIGRYFSTITQCILYKNDLVIGFSTAQKCYCDKEDQSIAYRVVTKKIMHLIPVRNTRKNIWELLNNR